MITKNNIKEVLSDITGQQILAVDQSSSDYVSIELMIFNAGYSVHVESWEYSEEREQELQDNGNLFLDKDEFYFLMEENGFDIYDILEKEYAKKVLEIESEVSPVNQAKQILKDAGYCVNSLWHISDVQDKYSCTDEQAMRIIEDSIDANTENIFESISFLCSDNDYQSTDDLLDEIHRKIETMHDYYFQPNGDLFVYVDGELEEIKSIDNDVVLFVNDIQDCMLIDLDIASLVEINKSL